MKNQEVLEFELPVKSATHLTRFEKILDTYYACRGCEIKVKKYIDKTPGEMLGKYLCNCRNADNELTGPIFPLYSKRNK